MALFAQQQEEIFSYLLCWESFSQLEKHFVYRFSQTVHYSPVSLQSFRVFIFVQKLKTLPCSKENQRNFINRSINCKFPCTSHIKMYNLSVEMERNIHRFFTVFLAVDSQFFIHFGGVSESINHMLWERNIVNFASIIFTYKFRLTQFMKKHRR